MMQAFLDPTEIQSSCSYAELNVATTQAFLDFAAHVCANPNLLTQATTAHDCLYEGKGDCDESVAKAEAVFGDHARTLRGLMVLDSIRRVRQKQAARGVSADITRAILEHHPCGTLRDYVAKNGYAGADAWIWHWYRTVGSGDLYQLGRLEFFIEKFEYYFRVFAHTSTGEVVALLNAGHNFTDEGYMLGQTTWTSELHEDEEAIIGNPISPLGYAIHKPVRLPRDEWHQVLGPSDIVLEMHIPGDEPLTLESVRVALEKAGPFFDHFYPGLPFKAFVCDSWVFSTQLEDMLSADSNIVRWQREGYLFPNDIGRVDFLNFIFGAPTLDLATAPRDTRLHRAVIAQLEQGTELRGGGYLLLRRDLPRFGSQPYRATKQINESLQ